MLSGNVPRETPYVRGENWNNNLSLQLSGRYNCMLLQWWQLKLNIDNVVSKNINYTWYSDIWVLRCIRAIILQTITIKCSFSHSVNIRCYIYTISMNISVFFYLKVPHYITFGFFFYFVTDMKVFWCELLVRELVY